MSVEFTYSEGPYCTCLECGALVSTDEIVAGNIYDGFETARDRHEAWHESLEGK